MDKIDVYLETGQKKVFAGAVDWPGWQRPGKDEASALQNLFEYGERYAQVLRPAKLDFRPPQDGPAVFSVVEKIEGDGGTEFGVPGKIPALDMQPVVAARLPELQAILAACWDAFIEGVKQVEGIELRKGPRGGGRDIEKMLDHVLGASSGYMSQIGWKAKMPGGSGVEEAVVWHRGENLTALGASVRGELPEKGPRGGSYWPARYFVRRSAWHLLDHLWEIEDRSR